MSWGEVVLVREDGIRRQAGCGDAAMTVQGVQGLPWWEGWRLSRFCLLTLA